MDSEHEWLTGLRYEDLWAYIKTQKGNNEAQRSYNAGIGALLNEINKVPQFRGKISPDDVDYAFKEALEKIKEPLSRTGKRKLEAILRKWMGVERDYDFHFDLGWLIGFPVGFQFGYGELRPFSRLPRMNRPYVERGFEMAAARLKTPARIDFAPSEVERWFLCIRQRTIGWHNAAERADFLATRSLAAYELVTGVAEIESWSLATPPRHDLVVVCHDRKRTGGRYHARPPLQLVINFPGSGFDELMNKMTRLMRNENRTEIENRIMAVVEIFAMLQGGVQLEAKYLLKVISLEALFLSEDDRDYLGYRLAEKIAFLLGDDKLWMAITYERLPHLGFSGNLRELGDQYIDDKFAETKKSDARRRLNREVVRLYRKRSAFAHQQRRNLESLITPYDYDMVSWLLRLSVVKMLSLTERGVTHLRKRSDDDPSSFDQLVEKLKY
ncbi:MAG: hypothetical protein JRN59_03850 [Nitrososphaerota archaeon]|nr:hypothetical protein [Nitrososphaerota archaeon]